MREVFASGRPIAQVAADLGIRREAPSPEAVRTPKTSRVLPADADTELKELRRENAELRRAIEIVKAASIFSRGSSTPDRGDERLHRGPQGQIRGRADLPHARLRPIDTLAARSQPSSARPIRDAGLIAQIHDARAGYRAVDGVRKSCSRALPVWHRGRLRRVRRLICEQA
jgi:transposase